MKKIAILLSFLYFAQAAFAGGTVLYSSSVDSTAQPSDPNATFVSSDSSQGAASSSTTREGHIRVGNQQNTPNTYWNFGRVNFGSGFSSEGSSTKRY